MTMAKGQTACTFVSFGITNQEAAIICGVLLCVIFLVLLSQAGSQKFIIFSIIMFPTLDVLSDIWYTITMIFQSNVIASLSVIFVFLPNVLFLYKLYCMNIRPGFILKFPLYYIVPSVFWLSIADGVPLINGNRRFFSDEKHDSILKFMFYLLSCFSLVLLQCLTILFYVCWCLLNIPMVILHFLLGTILFQFKVLAISHIWNLWFQIW